MTRIFRMIDETDSRLLAEVQRNGAITAQELGEKLNLSASQAARRRQTRPASFGPRKG